MEVLREIEYLQSQGDFDELSDLLRRLLSRSWDQTTRQAIEVAVDSIDQEGGLNTGLLADLLDVFSGMLGDGFSGQVSPNVNESVDIAYEGGRIEVRAGDEQSFPSVRIVDRRATQALGRYHNYWIREHYGEHVSGRIREAGEEVIRQGLGKVEAAKVFSDRLSGTFGQSEEYWGVVADAVVTQSRSFGQIGTYEELGIEEYEIDAVIDGRTSEICRYLDGMRFRVADAVKLRDKFLKAGTPAEARRLSPWLPAEQIIGKTAEQLTAMGVIAPAFHGRCRARTVIGSRG